MKKSIMAVFALAVILLVAVALPAAADVVGGFSDSPAQASDAEPALATADYTAGQLCGYGAEGHGGGTGG